jgi:hypothetical protein
VTEGEAFVNPPRGIVARFSSEYVSPMRDQRQLIRDALARAKARREKNAAEPSAVDGAQAPMLARLQEQWRGTIAPTLDLLADELSAAGNEPRITEPTEYAQGMFRLTSPQEEAWHPSLTFAVSEDGSSIAVTSLYGIAVTSPPVIEHRMPEELTAEYITALVVKLVDEGL